MNLEVFLQGFSVNGPGFSSWQELLNLKSEDGFLEEKTIFPPAMNLSSTERRRLTSTIKLALGVANDACEMAQSSKDIASFFASSKGDSDIMNYLGQVLATEERLVSPTKFHNSLHNSASGYWSIACNSNAPIQALAAGPYTFAVGLLEAAMYARIEAAPALLVNYELEPPAELIELMKSKYSFGSAFYISPEKNSNTRAKLTLSVAKHAEITTMKNSTLESLRSVNNAAISLSVLQALSDKGTQEVTLPYTQKQQLKIVIET